MVLISVSQIHLLVVWIISDTQQHLAVVDKMIGPSRRPTYHHRPTVALSDSSLLGESHSSGSEGQERARLHCYDQPLSPLRKVDKEKYTVRMNTWRRNMALQTSVDYLSTCSGVAQIQVIWCDKKNNPPDFLMNHPSGKVVVEHHKINSLNERFNLLSPTPTLGILSIDDDMIRPCEALDNAFFRWTRAPERMVGFEPRFIKWEPRPSRIIYGRNNPIDRKGLTGEYNIALTSMAFFHRDYMKFYVSDLEGIILNMIHEATNCEDIAMSLLISACTGAKEPLIADRWAQKTRRFLTLKGGPAISADRVSHYNIRSICADTFTNLLQLQVASNERSQLILRQSQIFHSKDPSDPKYQLMGTQDDREQFILKNSSYYQPNFNTIERELLQQELLTWNNAASEKVKAILAPVDKVVADFKKRMLAHINETSKQT